MPEWAWDPEKDRLNRKNHGLPLAAGVPVLEGDPLALSRPDPHPDGDRVVVTFDGKFLDYRW